MSDGYLRKIKKIYKNIVFWIKFSLGETLINLGLFFTRLAGLKGKPSELDYLKGNYVSIFIYNFNFKEARRDCLEIARGRIGAKGDVYIIPTPKSLKQNLMHESFHSAKEKKPSEYHIVERGLKIKEENLAFGDKDFTTAFRFSKFSNIPYCSCFRCGKSLKGEDIRSIVGKLMRYVFIPESNKEEIVSSLITRGRCQFSLSLEAQKNLLRYLRKLQ